MSPASLSEHDRYYNLALGSLERSKFAAETIQKASAAIATLYTVVLALVFSVTDNRLPLRGITAPLFLGLAVVLSTVYLTYLVNPPGSIRRGIFRARRGPTPGLTPSSTPPPANEQKPTSAPEPAAYFWFLLGTGTAIILAGALLPLKAQGKPGAAAP